MYFKTFKTNTVDYRPRQRHPSVHSRYPALFWRSIFICPWNLWCQVTLFSSTLYLFDCSFSLWHFSSSVPLLLENFSQMKQASSSLDSGRDSTLILLFNRPLEACLKLWWDTLGGNFGELWQRSQYFPLDFCERGHLMKLQSSRFPDLGISMHNYIAEASRRSYHNKSIESTKCNCRGIACELWQADVEFENNWANASFTASFYFPINQWLVAREDYHRLLKQIVLNGSFNDEAMEVVISYVNFRPRTFVGPTFDVCAISPYVSLSLHIYLLKL